MSALLLFLEGFIGLTYQSMFFRQLNPEVGGSSPVIAVILGAFLGFMSLGYFTGGIKRKKPMRALAYNLVFVGVVAAIGLSSTFIALFFANLAELGFSRMLSLTIYSLIFTGSIAFIMGQSLPLIMQHKTYGDTASKKGGNALLLSTLGSTLGATIPAIYITPVIGATATVFVAVALSFIIGIVLIKNLKITLAITPFVILSSFTLFLPYLNNNFTSTAFMDIYLIKEPSGEKKMFANGLVMSSIDENGDNTISYIDEFQRTIKRQKIHDKDIVVLGAGAFMAHHGDENNNSYTYVDIDENLLSWAEDNFGTEIENINFVVDDARNYMNSASDNSVDVVLLDVYGSRYSLPEHLLTKEFFDVLKRKIKHGGVFMFNAIYDPQFKDELSRTLHATVLNTFPFCQTTQVTDDINVANIHYTCFVRKNDKNDIYVDDTRDISNNLWGIQ